MKVVYTPEQIRENRERFVAALRDPEWQRRKGTGTLRSWDDGEEKFCALGVAGIVNKLRFKESHAAYKRIANVLGVSEVWAWGNIVGPSDRRAYSSFGLSWDELAVWLENNWPDV